MTQNTNQRYDVGVVVVEEGGLPMLDLVHLTLNQGLKLIHSEEDVGEGPCREESVVEGQRLVLESESNLSELVEYRAELTQ